MGAYGDTALDDACSSIMYWDKCELSPLRCHWCSGRVGGSCQSEQCPHQAIEGTEKVSSPPATFDTASDDACSRHIYSGLCAQWFDCQWCPQAGKSGICQSRREGCPRMTAMTLV